MKDRDRVGFKISVWFRVIVVRFSYISVMIWFTADRTVWT